MAHTFNGWYYYGYHMRLRAFLARRKRRRQWKHSRAIQRRRYRGKA